MAWNNPICQTCKKPIMHPAQAVVIYAGKLFAPPFHHYRCLLGNTQKLVGDSASAPTSLTMGAVAATRIGSGGGAAYFGAMNSINELRSIKPSDSKARRKFQEHLNKGYWAILGFALVFDSLIFVALSNFSKLNFDAIRWIAFALLMVLGFLFTFSAISFVCYLLYIENEIKNAEVK